jgi:hypothetical protein
VPRVARMPLVAALASLTVGAVSLGAQPSSSAAAVRSAAAPVSIDAARVPPGVHEHHGPNGEIDVNTCSDRNDPGTVRCFARLRIDAAAKSAKPFRHQTAGADAFVGDDGAYSPLYLRSAYGVPAANPGATVAIVDAYDDARAESDLAEYRSYFGLSECTSVNGCFRKVDQRGGTTYPVGDQLWAMEISLDLDMVSAICPNCRLLLVEADSNSWTDMGARSTRPLRSAYRW